ncbi:hypothetical protein QN277_025056 [Acacia crassicarpa]|uniref:Uncharacterized protein n=1 Tax=Acacia crassicarpa TaxID=499986 RepID=A0AAE1MKX9_9FABA|nr:hypothetical protein QN277_025056 [Acacia crassicarpa]
MYTSVEYHLYLLGSTSFCYQLMSHSSDIVIANWIFMSSTTTGPFSVSCAAGNKNSLFCWILLSLLPKYLGTPFARFNFLLIQAIDRSPSAVKGI